MSILAAGVNGGLAYIVKPTLDGIFVNKNRDLLYILPFAIVALYLLKSLLRFALNYTLRYMGQKVVETIRIQLYEKMIYLPVRFFSDNSTGTLISRITNDVNMMQTSVPTLVSVIRDILSVVGLIIVIFVMNYKMALLAIIVYPVFIHPFTLLSKRIRRYSKKGQEEMAEMTSVLQESFSGVRVVKTFTQEQHEVDKFKKSNSKLVKFMLKASLAAEIASPMMEFVSSFGIAGIIIYGGSQVINGDITAGAFFAFLAAITMVYEPVKRLGNSNSTIQQAFASAERVFEVMAIENDIVDKENALICEAKGKDVNFKNVNFKYHPDEEYVLKNINFQVKHGVTVAFVGHSGAGKTTIANLLPRLYDVTEGAICIGETDIRDFTIKSLRNNIGYVSQEPFLFNESITNNINYLEDRKSEEEIVSASKAAYAHDFIQQLPDGYNTVIGERGVRLSGGQKQRITIARALLKNPPILILDEATSALDTESEREVQQALDNLMVGRTCFIIAHRLSTIINADIIVVLEHGKIVATGTHKELLETNPIYKKLYLNQSMVDIAEGE